MKACASPGRAGVATTRGRAIVHHRAGHLRLYPWLQFAVADTSLPGRLAEKELKEAVRPERSGH